MDDPTERLRVAHFNLGAGRKAKASAATSTAFDYFVAGLSLLPEDAWHSCYDLTLALHEETAETAYLAHRYDEMERHVEQLLANAATTLDTARAVEIRIFAATARGHLKEAVDIGLAFLDQLGFCYPSPVGSDDVTIRLQQVQALLADRRHRKSGQNAGDDGSDRAVGHAHAQCARRPRLQLVTRAVSCAWCSPRVELFVHHGKRRRCGRALFDLCAGIVRRCGKI